MKAQWRGMIRATYYIKWTENLDLSNSQILTCPSMEVPNSPKKIYGYEWSTKDHGQLIHFPRRPCTFPNNFIKDLGKTIFKMKNLYKYF